MTDIPAVFTDNLTDNGFFDRELLNTYGHEGTSLGGHPDMHKVCGVEAATGALGHGFGFGVGMAFAGKMDEKDYRVFALLGDGECQEGIIWEAAMAAAHLKADSLTAIVDYNKYQETGPISREMALEPLVDKWRSFGWFVREVDGHDIGAILDELNLLQDVEAQPAILIAHTIKGKGVSFVEADFTYHGRPIVGDLADKAREEIRCG